MGSPPTTRTRRGQAKENPAALRRAEWHNHVRTTPPGMIPQVMLGTVFVYGVAMGNRWTTSALLEYFAGIAPLRYWPAWMRRASMDRRR